MTAEAILQTWFKTSIKPRKSILWVSAIAPETFQRSPRVLNELLKRPLETPDAMGQRKASIRYGTCLIAQAITTMNLDANMLHSILLKLDFLRHPDFLSHHSLPKSIQPTIKQMIQQGYDPTPIWEQRITSATQAFQSGLRRIAKTLKLKTKSLPSVRVTSYFEEESSWWGANYHFKEKIINLLPPFLLIPNLARGLLIREGIRILLPPSLQNTLDAQEFASILTSNILDPKHRQSWLQMRWGGTQLTPEQINSLTPLSNIVAQLIEQKRLAHFFKDLKNLNQLASEVQGGILFSANKVLKKPVKPPRITQAQQKILLTFAQDPTLSERQLSLQTEFARGTITRNLKVIRDHWGLRSIGEINYPKIGLIPLFLNISRVTSQKISSLRALKLKFEAFPYSIRMHSLKDQIGSNLFTLLALPQKCLSEFSKQLDSWMSHTGLQAELYQVYRFEWGWHFQWWQQFNDEEWHVLTQSNLREIRPPFGYNMAMEYGGTPMKLTRESLRILAALEENTNVSTRMLAKTAQTSISTATHHRNRFIPAVLTPTIELSTPPFGEALIFTVNVSPSIRLVKFDGIFRLLPAYQIWFLTTITEKPKKNTSNPIRLVAAAFPQGGLVRFASTLDDILNYEGAFANSYYMTSSLIPRTPGIPLALFSPVGQQWDCSSTLIKSLFE